MKKIKYLFILILIGVIGASNAMADVNEEITFTNLTDEDIYVELAVIDDAGWTYYDLWVLESGTSIANFWADTIFATYSACAYGEITDDFYGCIEGEVSHGFKHVYFDNSGIPFLSDAPNVAAADIYMFDSPHTPTADVLVIEGEGHGHGSGCFIGSL